MTKKDYELIAAAIADAVRNAPNAGGHSYHYDIASNPADRLERDNPRFDRFRFLRACGIDR